MRASPAEIINNIYLFRDIIAKEVLKLPFGDQVTVLRITTLNGEILFDINNGTAVSIPDSFTTTTTLPPRTRRRLSGSRRRLQVRSSPSGFCTRF